MHSRWTAFAVLALVFGVWATAIPVGIVEASNYTWHLPAWEGGDRTLHGSAKREGRGFGLPGGLIRHTTVVWTAWYRAPAGAQQPVPVTPAMKAAILPKPGYEELKQVGWRIELGGVIPPAPLLALLFWLLTCSWWVSCEWRWDPDAGARRNAIGVGVRMIWPALLLSSHGWLLADLGWKPAVTPWVHPDLAVVLTALVVSLLVVLFATRPRPTDEPSEPVRPVAGS